LAAMANSAARLLASANAPLSSRRSPASFARKKAPRPLVDDQRLLARHRSADIDPYRNGRRRQCVNPFLKITRRTTVSDRADIVVAVMGPDQNCGNAGACCKGVSIDKDLVPCGIDRADGAPSAILFTRKAGDHIRGERSGNERSGRHTIAIPRTGIVNMPSSTQETNAAADRSAVVGSSCVPRRWRAVAVPVHRAELAKYRGAFGRAAKNG
jgi:hypothetical protein